MKRALEFILLISILVLIILFSYLGFAKQTIGRPDNNKLSPIALISHASFFTSKNEELFQEISKQKTGKIVLISVDHYAVGDSITVKTENFTTAEGEYLIDNNLAEIMIREGIAQENEAVFINEHGIKNTIPLLNKYYPKSKVTALTLRDDITKGEVDNLADFLNSNCSDCTIIGSVDCSHYNPSSLANTHDSFTLSSLNSLDEDKVWLAETDSPQTIRLITKMAKSRGYSGFETFYNSNTGQVNNDYDSETTSVIIGLFTTSPQEQKRNATFVIAGDLMTDRLINHRFKNNLNEILSEFGDRVFWGSDLMMLNLEGPVSDMAITDDVSVDNLTFNFPSQTIDLLKYLRINAVTLANNHTLNAGRAGFETTLSLLEGADIIATGRQDAIDSMSIARFDSQIPLSVITINNLSVDASQIIPLIEKEKTANRYVIIFPHWGNEYSTKHNLMQEQTARMWIRSGADMIIGSHPHVIQDMQIIEGKPVIYSLGNFVFDQTFSKETQQGLILAGIISDQEIKISFIPTEQKNLKPQLIVGDEKKSIIGKIVEDIENIQFVSNDTIIIKNKEG